MRIGQTNLAKANSTRALQSRAPIPEQLHKFITQVLATQSLSIVTPVYFRKKSMNLFGWKRPLLAAVTAGIVLSFRTPLTLRAVKPGIPYRFCNLI